MAVECGSFPGALSYPAPCPSSVIAYTPAGRGPSFLRDSRHLDYVELVGGLSAQEIAAVKNHMTTLYLLEPLLTRYDTQRLLFSCLATPEEPKHASDTYQLRTLPAKRNQTRWAPTYHVSQATRRDLTGCWERHFVVRTGVADCHGHRCRRRGNTTEPSRAASPAGTI